MRLYPKERVFTRFTGIEEEDVALLRAHGEGGRVAGVPVKALDRFGNRPEERESVWEITLAVSAKTNKK